MGEVVQFPKSAHKNAAMIDMLETMLERAKKGELKFFAFASIDQADNNGYSAWAPTGLEGADLTAAIGSISFLHARFMSNVVAGCQDGETVDDLDPDDAA